MPNEALIAEIESMLSEIIRLGGENERSQMVPNLTVQNINPGKTGFILVSDSRDGDNILAKTVPGVIYSVNDTVNVMFIKGGEAIAVQQGSQSTNANIWGIVSGTTTDIYYNFGDVGIGKAVAPDARLELLDTAQAQLRLTFQEDTKFADFTLDTNHDLTIDPSSTGQIILATDDVVIQEDLIHSGDTDTKIIFTTDDIEFQAGALSMLKLTEAAQDIITLGAGSGDIDIDFNGDGFLVGSTGNWGFGTQTPGTDRVAFQGPSGANLAIGFYTGDGDGTDFSSLVMYGVGTPGSIANRERLILQYNQAVPNFRVQSEAAGTGTLRALVFETSTNSNQLVIETDGTIGINGAPTVGKLDIRQTSTVAAIPVVRVTQADVDQDFIRFDGTAASADLTRSIVDNGDVATATLQGWLKVFVNDIGNQITDQSYYFPIYTLT